MSTDPLKTPPAIVEDEVIPPELPPTSGMDETFEWMAQRNNQRLSVPRSRSFSRKKVVSAFEGAFELIGGVPRLALWAHENPGDFYRLFSKLLPSTSQTLVGEDNTINIIHSIAPGRLDGVVLEQHACAICAEQFTGVETICQSCVDQAKTLLLKNAG